MKTPEERLTRGKGNFINCTDYDDAVQAMKEYAIEYHEQQVKNLNIPAVINQVCEHIPVFKIDTTYTGINKCVRCGKIL